MLIKKEIKIKKIIPKDNYILECFFNNGVKKLYDVGPLLENNIFSKLRNNTNFFKVKVDIGGYGISWNDEIDIAVEELWGNGIEV